MDHIDTVGDLAKPIEQGPLQVEDLSVAESWPMMISTVMQATISLSMMEAMWKRFSSSRAITDHAVICVMRLSVSFRNQGVPLA